MEDKSEMCERDAIADIWGPDKCFDGDVEDWAPRVDQYCKEKPDKWIQSACVMCSNGCGMDIGVKDGRMVGVRGRAVDRVNKGRLGPKGLYSWQSLMSNDRLKHPLVRKGGELVEISWEEAMELVVAKTKEVQKEMTEYGLAFYTTGQLLLEEYYAMAKIGKVGFGTLHMDGNTRLCTATAAASMREPFWGDGQQATQTVLWRRILDRLNGPRPPKLIVVDPRRTETAARATIHLAPTKVGTNMALLNGLQLLIIENGYVDREFVEKHTVGFDDLKKTVYAEQYKLESVEKATGIPAEHIRHAAMMIGTSTRVVFTALQGVYQSNQATASACQINNLALITGKIGKPGSGVLQMNGQPTAQNNRETGCNGEYPGFRNFENVAHMQKLADLWNIPLTRLPHWNEPTHVMNLLQHIEKDSIGMLWVIGTNPLVSLPDLERTRKLFTKEILFLVVQDIFLTETASVADVVLPAAAWGEKDGCFTNADRTVHISCKAVEPPGTSKSDFDIFIDYGRRMNFRDQDGNPLLGWSGPEEAFNEWREVSKGCICDYSGLTWEKLKGGSGIQWPCNDQYPNGKERLYDDFIFPTDLESCESYGHNLDTGAPLQEDEYRILDPAGRAIIKTAHYHQSPDAPNEEFPLGLTTGRNVFHFHTRTKTRRAPQLVRGEKSSRAATVQLNKDDAEVLGVRDGDLVEVRSKSTTENNHLVLPARVGDIARGNVFVPFHFGYFDQDPDDPHATAANELTVDRWDPVSKQPTFKTAAVKVQKAANRSEIRAKRVKTTAEDPTIRISICFLRWKTMILMREISR